MKTHQAAELYPLMEGEEFEEFVADIAANGLRDPIVMIGEEILDGRNRMRACERLNLTPRFEEWDGVGSPEQYVASMNLHRRHLTASQRAMIAAKLATGTLADSRKNLRRGNKDQQDSPGVGIPTPTIVEAAKLLGVHPSSVSSAKEVLRTASAEAIASIERGEENIYHFTNKAKKEIKKTIARRKEKEKASTPPISPSLKGKNPQRIQQMKIKAEIWSNLRSAIENLTSLPAARDVVVIAKNHDKAGFMEDRLLRAAVWMEEFINEWAKAESGNPKAESGTADKSSATQKNTNISAA